MRWILAALLVGALGVFGGASETPHADAAFHFMRIYGVMGGALGQTDIQYVELRMAASGQNFVAGHDICFYNANGSPYARFRFPGSVANGASGASILVGSSGATGFDANWAAGSPDFSFSGNTVAITSGADVGHPVRSPSGKVAFGTDVATNPALMCQASFSLIDSLAYGTGYTGTVDYGAGPFAQDLPAMGTSAALLQGAVIYGFQDNTVDYAIEDVNAAGNNPRNNAGASGPVTSPDMDGDGVLNTTDNCPAWPNPGQELPSWSVDLGADADCDGFADTTQFGLRAPEPFVGTDPADACADTTTLFDERGPMFGEPLSPWTTDINDNRITTLGDVLAVAPYFNSPNPNPNYWARFDWNGDGKVTLGDVLSVAPFFNLPCTG